MLEGAGVAQDRGGLGLQLDIAGNTRANSSPVCKKKASMVDQRR